MDQTVESLYILVHGLYPQRKKLRAVALVESVGAVPGAFNVPRRTQQVFLSKDQICGSYLLHFIVTSTWQVVSYKKLEMSFQSSICFAI